MLRRKVENLLRIWKEGKKALLIDGARQVGKTYILRKYADDNFESSIYLNLLENKNAVSVLSLASDTKDFLMRLSALVDRPFIKGNTVIFLDEIQELTRNFDLVTIIKFLVDDGSYRYILSGSMLGVELTDAKSWPVGYLMCETMYPLDFEEFLWANDVNDSLIEHARYCFEKRIPLEDYIHEKFMRMFQNYLLVGGMPDAVNAFVETSDFNQVTLAHRAIQSLNRKDIAKYAAEDERLSIKQIFDIIPEELNSKSKRFMLKDIEGLKRGDDVNISFKWLQSAGVAIPVYNTTEPVIPLQINKERTTLKLFMEDVGLLTNELMDSDVKAAILSGDVSINNGSIVENFCSQLMLIHGFEKQFYFNNKKKGEVDFLVEYKGRVLPIEVKSGKNYNAHAALDNMMKTSNYNLDEAYVFCISNVKTSGEYTYFPIYMIDFLVKKDRYLLGK
ncbi:MAG: ATP-binding protein [Prevotella sp.]|nr:ATP-binding protein [Prevotella sp.]